MLQQDLPEQAATFPWTYVWLGFGALVLVLFLLAFVYLLVRKERDALSKVLHRGAPMHIDRYLDKHFPGPWSFVQRRFAVHQWYGLGLTVGGILFFAAISLFAFVTEESTSEEALHAFDEQIYNWLIASTNAPIISFLRAVTHMGDMITMIVLSLVTGAALLLLKRKWQFLALFMTVGVGSGIMWALKGIFRRARPLDQLSSSMGHSFPSGHSFVAVAFYGFLIYLTWRLTRRDAVRIGITILLTLLIVIIGLSRIVLRVHWVSDVAGGFTFGLAWLVCSLIITRAIRSYRSPGETRDEEETLPQDTPDDTV